MNDKSRLIEHSFPLKQSSLDSVHEKNVRHAHISTLHIWPARRPLAACRAALIATLLPDPGTEPKPEGISEKAWDEEILRRRKVLCEKIGGKVTKKIERKKGPTGEVTEREKEETAGGILHWGRETENHETLDWFRKEIRKAYCGRAPKVLDPFAGGGAIPLEAMRLGCEATAIDLNPVAWFILKCTLEYPQQLGGQTFPLPRFILEDEEFMDSFYKAHPHLIGRTKKTKKQIEAESGIFPEYIREDSGRIPKVNLAWHVRAWGKWIQNLAREELARYYPTYADFEHLRLTAKELKAFPTQCPFEKQPMRLVPFKKSGMPDIQALNKEFGKNYLDDKKNPRWVAKPTVAYFWARTVECKNCRGTIPLLKTRWLCKKENKRVLLAMEPNSEHTGVNFWIETEVPTKGETPAQRKEHDKIIGGGTMSRSGAKCPCCDTIMTMEDIRLEGKAGRLGSVMTAVAVEGQKGKEYRLPTEHEIQITIEAENAIKDISEQIPFGIPEEPTPKGGTGASRAFSVDGYGFDEWNKIFTPRQILALGTFVKCIRKAKEELQRDTPEPWSEAVLAYLVCSFDRMLDFNSSILSWITSVEAIGHTFVRYALPITWDFCEAAPINAVRGGWEMCMEACTESLETIFKATASNPPAPGILNRSAVDLTLPDKYDIILTDPPYYDAIPYSDLMDYFYIWMRRTLRGMNPEFDETFKNSLSPKWTEEKEDGELIDDSSRHGGDREKSKRAYENGMARAFQQCYRNLYDHGRLVIVFAHKHPDAWETLVSAIIRAGFVVDGSWPIQTEQSARMRAQSSAALASSVWLVCRKRPETAKPGWDNHVLEEMRTNIRGKLQEFWDAGTRGPDFVWAATGPALEAYSRHPLVKKANAPGPMTVGEFLIQVRRMVVDFVVGRVLSGDGDSDLSSISADRLDEPTAYYLLHRHDFGLEEAPAGACILYAISCGLSDKDLWGTWDLTTASKDKEEDLETGEEDPDAEIEGDSGGKLRLKTWTQRRSKTLGFEAPGGKEIPLIDRVHCLMHLWKAGDLSKVDGYLDANGLRKHELFKRLLQSVIELSSHASEERTLLESISNHLRVHGSLAQSGKMLFPN